MEIEYRYELKFVLSQTQAFLLKQQLKAVMQLDEHSISDEYSYQIRSIYFDDDDDTALHEKTDGVEYRKKYRLRMYNFDDRFLRLECKHKDENMTYKESCKISRSQASFLLDGRYDRIITDNGFFKQFLYDALSSHLIPKVIVDYTRLAFVYPVSDVRITFDEELRSGRYDRDFFKKSIVTHDIYDDKGIILEVKCNEFIPEHILNILNSVPMVRQSFSKFVACQGIK
ncbi:MAG: polyphosphate polymerase domain-containing protein [Erysipelotrichaceae bacterium]|nr:polyphosphate polymerase domain-containing protein [Erysipelotrichaceae bacterium]